MSKLDNAHPLMKWLIEHGRPCGWLSEQLGRSQACVSRWIRSVRLPSPTDQETIAEITEGAVPISVWHEQALQRQSERRAKETA